MLGWLPQMLQWMNRNQSKVQRKTSALAIDFLAENYGVGTWAVQAAVSGRRGGQTDTHTIRSILLAAIRERERQRVPAPRMGRPREPETKRRIQQIAAFLSLGWRPKQFAGYVFPDKHAPESAFLDLRQFRYDNSALIKATRTRLAHNSAKAQHIVDALGASQKPPNLLKPPA
jgi:hypothetical protein